MILGLNGVVVGRHGLILWENDATGVRKVFRYLPDLRDLVKKIRIMFVSKKSENSIFPYVSVYSDIRGRRHGRSPILLTASKVTALGLNQGVALRSG